MLKSSLLDGKLVPLSILHSGALLSDEASKLKFKVTKLEHRILALHQYDTAKKNREEFIEHQTGVADIREGKHFAINGSSASAGDGFCGVELEDGTKIREIHQYKHIKDKVDPAWFEEERKKAAQNDDLFIMYTTNTSTWLGLQGEF
jgi:hypothetical protein